MSRPTAASERPRIEVTAAVIERGRAFFLTRRPGGKRHDGESLRECLVREIREELDAEIVVGEEMLVTSHDYPERTVELHFFRCALLTEPRPVLGQEMRWAARDELG